MLMLDSLLSERSRISRSPRMLPLNEVREPWRTNLVTEVRLLPLKSSMADWLKSSVLMSGQLFELKFFNYRLFEMRMVEALGRLVLTTEMSWFSLRSR